MSWFDKAVFYHIYPLGLLDAPKKNDMAESVNRLEELEEWIPHIKQTGFNAIYIGPLFESVGHGYETTDYKKVDKRLGNNKAFQHFVDECHKEDIKIIVDGVFNHTGREFFAFRDLRQNRQNSPYKDWYVNINFNGNNEYNDGFSYKAWRGHSTLCELNLKSQNVKDYLFEVIRYWVSEFNIDGIRLDCADVLDFEFMKDMRAITTNLKKDFWLMGEVIHGDYSRWVNADMLHSVTNYELHKGLYSGHNDHNYFEIAHTVKRLSDPNGGLCKDYNLYTFLDNHDVERIISKLNEKEHIYSATILMYTLPGIPSIYYGSEFCIEGKKEKNSDDSLRPALKLSDFLIGHNKELRYKEKYETYINLLSTLSKLRTNSDILAAGAYKELRLTNRQYAFARILDSESIIVAVNNDSKDVTLTIPIPLQAKVAIDYLSKEEYKIQDGTIEVSINAYSGVVFEMS